MTNFFLENNNSDIIGYNLENTTNGKSASKIAKWPSLRPLAFNFMKSRSCDGLLGHVMA